MIANGFPAYFIYMLTFDKVSPCVRSDTCKKNFRTVEKIPDRSGQHQLGSHRYLNHSVDATLATQLTSNLLESLGALESAILTRSLAQLAQLLQLTSTA